MKRFFSISFLVSLAVPLFAAELPPTLPLGAPAPDFRLKGVDGKTHTLREFKSAKVFVVIFNCVHCPTAQYYEERIKKIVVDYKSKGVTLVAISPNDPKSVRLDELGYTDLGDSFEDMKIRAKDRKFNFPFLYDGDTEEVSRAYGPVATPHAYVFDAGRKLRYVGRIDDNEIPGREKVHDLRNAIDDLLAGRDVAVKQTKTFGCSIKWGGKLDGVKAYLAKLAAEPVAVTKIDAEGLKALRKNDSGKLRMVNFWATWCGPCVTEFPELITINRMYRQREFEMITVSANTPDEEKKVLAFLQKQQSSGKNFLFASDDKYPLIEAFDPKWEGALPYTVLISPAGEIIYKQMGEIDPLELKRAIVKNLKGYHTD